MRTAMQEIQDDTLVDRRNMRYELDRGIGHRARVGLIVLATDQTIEHEFRHMLDLPGVALYENRIYNSSTITPETLRAMEADITRTTELIMPPLALDVVAFACNSGAMVIGDQRVHAAIHRVRPGVACTTPMAAAFAAFRALGVRRPGVVTPYADEINRTLREYMQAQGLAVPVLNSWNLPDDAKVACITERSIRAAVLELGRAEAVDGVLVACSSLRAAALIEDLERELGKPVTSTNHALAWHCLRLAGIDDKIDGYGRLFAAPLP